MDRRRTARGSVVVLSITSAIASTGCTAEKVSEPAAKLSPSKRVFDGFSIGDKFSSLSTRAPYDKPCSSEMIENGLYRAVVFCDDPKAAFILAGDEIRAFGWVSGGPDVAGGGYFATKIELPVHLGDSWSRALAVFGEVHDMVDLTHMHADRYEDDVCVISSHRTVLGFVFGDMPAASSSERWRVFDALIASTSKSAR